MKSALSFDQRSPQYPESNAGITSGLLQMNTALLRLAKKYFSDTHNNGFRNVVRLAFLIIAVIMSADALPTYAENGSAQAIIALIVPPGNGNATLPSAFSKTTVYQPNPVSATYNPDTSLTVSQTFGAISYQVWVAL